MIDDVVSVGFICLLVAAICFGVSVILPDTARPVTISLFFLLALLFGIMAIVLIGIGLGVR